MSQHAEDPLLENGSSGRRVPVGIESAPILPIGAGRLEQVVVNDHQIIRLEKPDLVGRIRRHEIARQVGPEQADDPCQRRSAAAMHAEHDNRAAARVNLRARRIGPFLRLRFRTANTAPRCSRFDGLVHPEILTFHNHWYAAYRISCPTGKVPEGASAHGLYPAPVRGDATVIRPAEPPARSRTRRARERARRASPAVRRRTRCAAS